MRRRLFLFYIGFLFTNAALAQADSLSRLHPDTLQKNVLIKPDTTLLTDTASIANEPDSVSRRPRKDSSWKMSSETTSMDDVSRAILQRHPYYGFANEKLVIPPSVRAFHGKELLFYLLVFLLMIYAFLRLIFPKYFNDLFRLFFRTTLKQRQIREQLMQTPLPSLLLNGFFVVIGGLYIAFILQYYKLEESANFWLIFLYSGLGLSAIYFIKFVGLKFTGWLFNLQEIANSYIFIVFVINKMLGMLLLPFLILLAFTDATLFPIAMVLSFCVIGGLIAYRFILSYAAIHNQVRLNPFHFFLYLVALEVAPLLLIYKGLLLFFRISA